MKPKTYFKKHMNGDLIECIDEEAKLAEKNPENPLNEAQESMVGIDQLLLEVDRLSKTIRRQAVSIQNLCETIRRMKSGLL